VLLHIAILLSHDDEQSSQFPGNSGIHHDFIVIIQSPSSPSTIIITQTSSSSPSHLQIGNQR
jgi:hypothetical protein